VAVDGHLVVLVQLELTVGRLASGERVQGCACNGGHLLAGQMLLLLLLGRLLVRPLLLLGPVLVQAARLSLLVNRLVRRLLATRLDGAERRWRRAARLAQIEQLSKGLQRHGGLLKQRLGLAGRRRLARALSRRARLVLRLTLGRWWRCSWLHQLA